MCYTFDQEHTGNINIYIGEDREECDRVANRG